ncbi:MAG: hypothetical protein JNM17_00365 [Archangium sp.]|nr:hypothetical protein [Archangium sp.]
MMLPSCVVAAALAQLSTAQPTVPISPPMGTTPVRWPDVTSTGSSGFLAIAGANNIMAQRFDLDGQPVGAAFTVNSDALFAQGPRVAFAPQLGVSLVTWHATINATQTQVRGRFVRTDGTTNFDISSPGTNWEMGSALAWSSRQQLFLVAWQNTATQIAVQRVNASGQRVGTELLVDPSVGYERDPSVGYDVVADQFLVAYAGCVGNDDCLVRAQFIDAANGTLVGAPLVLEAPVLAGYIPELAWDALNERFLAVWYRTVTGNAALRSRTVKSDRTLGTAQTASPMYASYDANSVAWNATSGTFVVVSHATAQDVAVELTADGVPLSGSVLWGPTGVTGNFNPRIAASSERAEWLGVTSTEFGRLSAQRLTTTTRVSMPMDAGVDAGTEDAGVDAGVDAGTSPTDAGTSQQPASDAGMNITGTGSCGCASQEFAGLLFTLLLLLRPAGASKFRFSTQRRPRGL